MSWKPISKAYVFVINKGKEQPIGVVDMNNGVYRFAYGKKWLVNPNAFSIDPINLPLSDKTYLSSKLWGCLEDATPDNWGKKVLLSLHSHQPQNPIEWLLASRGAGVGDLGFSATLTKLAKMNPTPRFDDLVSLMEVAHEIDEGDDNVDPALAKMLWYGSSMGGARPKVTVSHDGYEWIAKLGRDEDVFDQVRAEHACLNIARTCGLDVSHSELIEVGGKPVLLVKRFDRAGDARLHYLSAYAAIHPERAKPNDPESIISYAKLAEIVRRISSQPKKDLRELFSRMSLNCLIGNSDDHLKNHGFLRIVRDEYRLSPAFDILPHPEQMSEQALMVGKYGRRSTVENVLSGCENFGLSHAEAKAIVDSQIKVLSKSHDFFREAGMNERDIRLLHKACNRLTPQKQFDNQLFENTP